LIDEKTSSRKVAFDLVKVCKNKDSAVGNASMAWERLKNKFELSFAPSLVKLEIQFRQCSLKKGHDSGIRIIELEDYRLRLEELGSSISDNQFILHVLNNMTDDYDLQLAMMEKRVTDKSKPLTIDKIRDYLNLKFKILNEKQNEESENDNNQEVAKDCRLKQTKMAFITEEITTIFRKIRVMALIALFVVDQVILRSIVSNRRINSTVTVVQVTTTVKDREFLIPMLFVYNNFHEK
jgi:hypothetical protein